MSLNDIGIDLECFIAINNLSDNYFHYYVNWRFLVESYRKNENRRAGISAFFPAAPNCATTLLILSNFMETRILPDVFLKLKISLIYNEIKQTHFVIPAKMLTQKQNKI
ncbi:hypothetical protein HC231_12510 [Brenneria izadpanahii]|uniref:Uncharacterized protein n=1 Tax=Brenneria izadpanahii TaxID=2722756 RepID=A0ABX7USS4_9GAMM|nr:hypothetical protein [Brenneria izadpanahii]QTF08634.1 hypothetical protein HC231_12510 [Brenneria izadpanahii]